MWALWAKKEALHNSSGGTEFAKDMRDLRATSYKNGVLIESFPSKLSHLESSA